MLSFADSRDSFGLGAGFIGFGAGIIDVRAGCRLSWLYRGYDFVWILRRVKFGAQYFEMFAKCDFYIVERSR